MRIPIILIWAALVVPLTVVMYHFWTFVLDRLGDWIVRRWFQP